MAERSTVEGAVQSLIFQNEDNGYTVLSLLADDGELVTVVGCIPCAAPGERMTVTGVWTNHPSYGPQFAAESVERYHLGVAALIVAEGDLMGCVMLLMGEHDAAPTESEQTLAQTFAGFLGKQMES